MSNGAMHLGLQVLACRLSGAKPTPQPILNYCQLDIWEQILIKIQAFSFKNTNVKTMQTQNMINTANARRNVIVCLLGMAWAKCRLFCPGLNALNVCNECLQVRDRG